MKKSYENSWHRKRKVALSTLSTGTLLLAAGLVACTTYDAPDPSQRRRDEQLNLASNADAAPRAVNDDGSIRLIEVTPSPGWQVRPALYTREASRPARPGRDRLSALIQAHIDAINSAELVAEIPELCE